MATGWWRTGKDGKWSWLLLLWLGGWGWVQPASTPRESPYLGSQVCGQCHADILEETRGSNLFSSWRPSSALARFPLPLSTREGDIYYEVAREGDNWVFRVHLPGRTPQSFPIHSIVGGERFGISFLLQVSQLEGRSLGRAALVEARYMMDAETRKLKLSPGFPTQTPTNYETALGRVLSPVFTEKCLGCHGGVADARLASQGGPHPWFQSTGVSCERCHGPGRPHLEAVASAASDLAIVNPRRLSHPQVMELCGECHTGFFSVPQPRPEDVIISNQVTALRMTECYIQSGRGFSCISCHNPHRNATHEDPVYVRTCLSCHTAGVTCPVNPKEHCVDCHMPVISKPGNFRLVDHWIRIPEPAESP